MKTMTKIAYREADNLYVLLYSRYYTTRYMVQQLPNPPKEPLEDDEQLKRKFRDLMKTPSLYVSRDEFENGYSNIIEKIKGDQEVSTLYKKLTKKLLSSKLDGRFVVTLN